MAITGTFGADFSAFVSEVAKAQAALGGLTEDAEKAQAGLTEVGNVSLAGVTADAEAAAGSVKKLAEVDPSGLEYTAVAVKAIGTESQATTGTAGGMLSTLQQVGAAVGIGFSIGAVVAFGRAMIDTAGEIQKMADATGLSTDQVQGLMAAAAQTSTPMAAFTSAITGLQTRIGSNDAGLIKATKDLGLSWDEIKTLTPYDTFKAYAEAVGDVDDQNRQAAIGADVFSKAWREISSSVKQGAIDMAENAPKMSAGALTTLNGLDAKIKEVTQSFKVFVADAVAALAGEKTSAALKELADAAKAFNDQLHSAAPAARAVVEPFHAVTLTTAELGIEQRKLAADVERNTAALAAAADKAAAFKAWKEAFAEVSSAGVTLQATLDGIDGVLVELVREGLDGGASQRALATTYELTAAQVRAVAEAYRLEQAEAKKSADATEALTMALSREIVQRALATQRTLEADVTSRAHYEKLAADAATAYATAQAAGGQYTAARLEQLRTEADAAQETLNHWQDAADTALGSVKNTAGQARDAIRGANDELERVNRLSASWGAPVGQNMPLSGAIPYDAYANVPRWGVPGAGGILNMSAGAVTINYPIMDDPQARDAIGRVVGDAILERVTRGGATV